MHFAEHQEINSNQSRVFNLYINGDLWLSNGPLPLDQYPFRITSVISSTSDPPITPDSGGKIQVWINSTGTSNLVPLINAMEIYMVKKHSRQTTDENDGIYAQFQK
ncbi:Malectin-like carbohydrate-binding domain containing protein [Parasponia andersonii]|uniref:Malectin-like carbohydrate-binding domain containing protein n=1 Tax=Parasponia andersonii TaxID=3476 RepID=A0A2P5BGD2_PARAD|nr:Malectin-like carbohydrate-binding domain containing protein [Parasponia andersonii]